MDQKFKLIAVHGMNDGELYDLEQDPEETYNRWNDENYMSVKATMLKALCDKMAETVDPLPARTSNW
jgi:arylsulfatase